MYKLIYIDLYQINIPPPSAEDTKRAITLQRLKKEARDLRASPDCDMELLGQKLAMIDKFEVERKSASVEGSLAGENGVETARARIERELEMKHGADKGKESQAEKSKETMSAVGNQGDNVMQSQSTKQGLRYWSGKFCCN